MFVSLRKFPRIPSLVRTTECRLVIAAEEGEIVRIGEKQKGLKSQWQGSFFLSHVVSAQIFAVLYSFTFYTYIVLPHIHSIFIKTSTDEV